MASLLLSLTCALSFTGCGDDAAERPDLGAAAGTAPALSAVVADTVTAPVSALRTAVSDFFADAGSPAAQEYSTARLDLDGDGREDGLVLLTGEDWCGSGGCTLLVFQGNEAGYRLISETSLVNGPIVVSEARSNGWRDILVPDPSEDRTVMLRFNGAAYPSEPAGPAAADAEGETVFEGEIGLF